MQERKGVITFKGNPMTLLGPEIKVGDKAPDFRVVDTGLAPVTLADFKGKVKIISAVPSLDTPTCDTETRRFNQEAAKLPGNVVVLTVSLDLPFAQKRWCAAAGIDKVKTLSDYQDRSFAYAYGVLIKELRLLSRSIFVVDGSDTVRYVQHVKEVSQEPDYAAVLAAARGLPRKEGRDEVDDPVRRHRRVRPVPRGTRRLGARGTSQRPPLAPRHRHGGRLSSERPSDGGEPRRAHRDPHQPRPRRPYGRTGVLRPAPGEAPRLRPSIIWHKQYEVTKGDPVRVLGMSVGPAGSPRLSSDRSTARRRSRTICASSPTFRADRGATPRRRGSSSTRTGPDRARSSTTPPWSREPPAGSSPCSVAPMPATSTS